jgi:hypothetical protein
VLGLLAFVAPGFLVTRVFDAAAMERDVARVLVEDHGIGGVTAVGCSGQVRVVADTRFECTATIDGAAVAVPMRVVDDDGGYEVGRPS